MKDLSPSVHNMLSVEGPYKEEKMMGSTGGNVGFRPYKQQLCHGGNKLKLDCFIS